MIGLALTPSPWGSALRARGVEVGYSGQIKPTLSATPHVIASHALANGLLFYGFDRGDGVVVDVVSGAPASSIGPAISSTDGAYGRSLLYGLDAGRYFAASAAIRAATAAAPFSYACAYVKTDTVAGYSRPFARTAGNGGSPPYVNWGFEVNPAGAGQDKACADVNDNGNPASSNNWGGNADNVFTSLAGVATAANSYKFYAQAALITTKAVTAIQSADTDDSIMFSGSGIVTPATGFAGQVFYGGFWNRALSPTEVALLHSDPYCFIHA